MYEAKVILGNFEEEISKASHADLNIFGISDQSFWKDQLMKFGGEYRLWANAPEDPSFN